MYDRGVAVGRARAGVDGDGDVDVDVDGYVGLYMYIMPTCSMHMIEISLFRVHVRGCVREVGCKVRCSGDDGRGFSRRQMGEIVLGFWKVVAVWSVRVVLLRMRRC